MERSSTALIDASRGNALANLGSNNAKFVPDSGRSAYFHQAPPYRYAYFIAHAEENYDVVC